MHHAHAHPSAISRFVEGQSSVGIVLDPIVLTMMASVTRALTLAESASTRPLVTALRRSAVRSRAGCT